MSDVETACALAGVDEPVIAEIKQMRVDLTQGHEGLRRTQEENYRLRAHIGKMIAALILAKDQLTAAQTLD